MEIKELSPQGCKTALGARVTARLQERESAGMLRQAEVLKPGIDFCSNDYLGMTRSAELLEAIDREWQALPYRANGAGASRLISGTSELAEEVESELAEWLGSEAALLFNSGYDANLGLLSALSERDVTIIYDELSHASIRDGLRLGSGRGWGFAHNDPEDLTKKLERASGATAVVVESVYSMDGDIAPLIEIADACQRFGAELIVDEAHATGIFGPRGAGLVAGRLLPSFARVHTFGKALGVHGAAVLCGRELRELLINCARSFMYTTALPPHSLVALRQALRWVGSADAQREKLLALSTYFNRTTADLLSERTPSESPIKPLIIPGNERVCAAADRLTERGFQVKAVRSPTVAQGRERLRISLHAFNTTGEIDALCGALREILI